MFFIFVLHLITFPSIHHISDEHVRYIPTAKHICNLDFSDFFGPQEMNMHPGPIYQIALCVTSPIHNFNLELAEITAYMFFIAMIIGWYYSIPSSWKVDKKKLVLLLFGNGLLWIYSFRVLIDVPLAFFLSLGMFNLYLFFEKGLKKNRNLGLIFTTLALFTKETAVIYFPILFLYLLFKMEHSVKKWAIIFLPAIPFGIFSLLQHLSGFPILDQLFIGLKSTTTISYSTIPYAHLPTIVFMLGIFGPGLIMLPFLIIKNRKLFGKEIRNYILFFVLLYIVWELFYDFVMYANLPRYHTTLMPFIALIASAMPTKKSFKYCYYLILIYSIISGFAISYYFHIETAAVWQALVTNG